MPRNIPTKKAAAPAAAAPATPAAPAAPVEWTDLAVAAQMEVHSDGSIINPFTKEVIAKDVGGLLDVRRPGAATLPRPEKVKIVGSVAATFAAWFMDECMIAPVTAKVASTRFGKEITLPAIEVDVAQTPFAFVTANLGKDAYGFQVVNGQIARVGKQTERGYIWAISDEFIKKRGAKMSARSSRGNAEEVFQGMMRSFGGKFQHTPAEDKPAPAKAPVAKAPPTKTAPKKVPAKK